MIITIEQLRADYEDLKDCSHYPAMERIMAAMPKLLNLAAGAISWRETAGDNYGDELFSDAVDDFTE